MNNEKDLIKAAKLNDKKTLEILYRSNFSALYKFIRFKVDSDQRAEDICAETFTKAFESLKNFAGESSFKSWLYTIAKNLIVDWYRSKDKETNINIEIADKDSQEDNSSNSVNILRNILEKLKENYKQVLELRFLSNLSIRETAEIMNITEVNVKVLQNRAIKKAQQICTELNIS